MRPVAFTDHWHEGHDGQPCHDEDCPERCDAHLQTIADLQAQVERLKSEVAHWKANHDSQVAKKRGAGEFRDRFKAERDAAVGLVVQALAELRVLIVSPQDRDRVARYEQALLNNEPLAAEAERQRLQREALRDAVRLVHAYRADERPEAHELPPDKCMDGICSIAREALGDEA